MNEASNNTILGAADLGYGFTKIWANGKNFRQPAVVGEPRRIRTEDIQKDDVRYYEGNSNISTPKYFIGDLAIRHSQIRYTSTGQDRAKTWITTVLLQSGLALTAGDNAVKLVTGLPVDYYFNQKSDFEDMLNSFNDNPSFAVSEGKSESHNLVNPKIEAYHIVPQPLGAFMNRHLDDKGDIIDKDIARKPWLVLDFGFGTFDKLFMEGLEIKPESSSPQGIAISTAYNLIQEELKDKLGHTPDVYTLDHYIQHNIDYDGYDLQPLKDWAFNAIASQAQNEIDSINRCFYGCIVTGGWAEDMTKRLQLPENTIIMNQLGNLKGYRKIGRRKWFRNQ